MFIIINLILLGSSMLFSFDGKSNFYSKSKFTLISLIITVLSFSVLDILFTSFGVWQYEMNKTLGFNIKNVPIETIMFYAVLCFSFITFFEFIKVRTKKGISNKASKFITTVLFLIFLIVALVSLGNIYTSLISVFLAVIFFQYLLFPPRWLPVFYKTFTILIIPILIAQFFIMSLKLISYNLTEKTGAYIINIPIENAYYMLLICIISVFSYHLFMPKKRKKTSTSKKIEDVGI